MFYIPCNKIGIFFLHFQYHFIKRQILPVR